jgi:hypothetical protein
MPPVFGTGPGAGPEVTPATFAEAEKLVQVDYTPAERAQAAGNWRLSMAPLSERRTGPRRVVLDAGLAPASRWDPVLPGVSPGPSRTRVVRSAAVPEPPPARDEDIAFAPIVRLSRWIESRALTSERLTRLYLDRLERFQPKLNCTITLTRDLALGQARRADGEIAAGRYRGPLHGIPWGAKDLVDTAGIPTTYGAEPFRDRVPTKDAAVVARLHKAGAVLVAKLSLGALALNDVWFNGETRNRGSSRRARRGAAPVRGRPIGYRSYQWEGPFVVDDRRFRARFGLTPTAPDEAAGATVAWAREHYGAPPRS